VFTRNLHFLPVDSPSRDNKRNFVKQIRQNVTQFCCTCYHKRALFSHPTEDNKTILDKKRVQWFKKKITIATNKQICRKS